MKVITSNLFIDYDGIRTAEMLGSGILTQMDPDIIMIQELHHKLKPVFDKALYGYKSVFPAYCHMACGIYVKNEFVVSNAVYVPFKQTFMERGIYAVELYDVWYITTHLESMDKPQFEAIRHKQVKELEDFIKDKSRVIIGMDSNIKGDVCIEDMVDVWYDNQISTWFASRFFGHNATERYDRFLSKGLVVNERDIIQNLYSDHDILYIDISEMNCKIYASYTN